MPLFKLQTLKTLNGDRFWSNVYLVEAADLTIATAAGLDVLVPFEQSIHKDIVLIHELRVSTATAGDNVFTATIVDAHGSVHATSDILPLFNTARVDFNVVGGGRPSRKYFRTPLEESNQADGSLVSTAITFLNGVCASLITDMAAAGAALSDPQGQLWSSASTSKLVQMRQLHRKRRHHPI